MKTSCCFYYKHFFYITIAESICKRRHQTISENRSGFDPRSQRIIIFISALIALLEKVSTSLEMSLYVFGEPNQFQNVKHR